MWDGEKLFYIQVGVSLPRLQSSRSLGCICLLDSSINAGVSLERVGWGDRQDGTIQRGGKEVTRKRNRQERRTVRRETKEMKEEKRKGSHSLHVGIKGTFSSFTLQFTH